MISEHLYTWYIRNSEKDLEPILIRIFSRRGKERYKLPVSTCMYNAEIFLNPFLLGDKRDGEIVDIMALVEHYLISRKSLLYLDVFAKNRKSIPLENFNITTSRDPCYIYHERDSERILVPSILLDPNIRFSNPHYILFSRDKDEINSFFRSRKAQGLDGETVNISTLVVNGIIHPHCLNIINLPNR